MTVLVGFWGLAVLVFVLRFAVWGFWVSELQGSGYGVLAHSGKTFSQMHPTAAKVLLDISKDAVVPWVRLSPRSSSLISCGNSA